MDLDEDDGPELELAVAGRDDLERPLGVHVQLDDRRPVRAHLEGAAGIQVDLPVGREIPDLLGDRGVGVDQLDLGDKQPDLAVFAGEDLGVEGKVAPIAHVEQVEGHGLAVIQRDLAA